MARKMDEPGTVWVSGKRMRRLIDVRERWVTYSRGGDHVHHCRIDTWRRWRRKAEPYGEDRWRKPV